MAASSSGVSAKEYARRAIQANKDHQYALKVYTERLTAELQTVDKLLASAESLDEDNEDETNIGGFILIPGSTRAIAPVASADLSSQTSPFATDARRRNRYLEFTTIHPMKGKEQDALAEAVRTENHRIHALQAQRRGEEALSSLHKHPPSYFEVNKEGIDWGRVAAKVSESSSSAVRRTAKECAIHWLGERHPEINHAPWTQPEITRVRNLLASMKAEQSDGTIDWVQVAEQLGTKRTPLDCMRYAIPRKVHSWDHSSDEQLLEAVKIFGFNNWNLVARAVSEDATAQQCHNRYVRSLDPELRRGPWSNEEDAALRAAYGVYGPAWTDIASLIPGRNADQCRERYTMVLQPGLAKGRWSEEEDATLEEAVRELGEGRWKEVSERLDGKRSDRMCRARYETLRKQREKEAASPVHPIPSSSAPMLARSKKRQSSNKPAPPVDFRDTSGAGEQTAPVTKPRPKPRPRAKGAPYMFEDEDATEPIEDSSTMSGNQLQDIIADAGASTGLVTVSTVEEGASASWKKRRSSRRLSEEEAALDEGDAVGENVEVSVENQVGTMSSRTLRRGRGNGRGRGKWRGTDKAKQTPREEGEDRGHPPAKKRRTTSKEVGGMGKETETESGGDDGPAIETVRGDVTPLEDGQREEGEGQPQTSLRRSQRRLKGK